MIRIFIRIYIRKWIIHYKFWPFCKTTIMGLKQDIKKNRHELINWKASSMVWSFITNLARLQTSFMHSPYVRDLSVSDFRLFWSLQNSIVLVKLTSREDCQISCHGFLMKSPNLLQQGIVTRYLWDGTEFSKKVDIISIQYRYNHK